MKLIFSAELSTLSADANLARSFAAMNIVDRMIKPLPNRTITLAQGSYKGAIEQSFILNGSMADVSLVRGLAFGLFGQESILQVNDDNQAYLMYANGHREFVGYWQRVPRNEALEADAHTLIGGKYYMAKKD